MSRIYAKKTLGGSKDNKQTVAKSFPKTAWDMMGKDHGGWSIINEDEFNSINTKKKSASVPPADKKIETPAEVEKKEVKEEVKEEAEKTGIADITIPDVIVHLKTLNTVEEIDSYVGNDSRKGVLSAVANRKEEIEETAK